VPSRPPDAVAPPPGNPRFPLLDPLRAVAALCIVVTHTAGLSGFNSKHWPGAWTARLDCGVAIFFVLSGFLLYRPFVAARLQGRSRPGVLRYARRRALRILPAYWLALVIQALVWPQYVKGVFDSGGWVYFTLLQSWSSHTILGGLGVAWSLSVEMAFYILLPVYAFAAARLCGGDARRELRLLAAMFVLAVIARIVVHAADPMSVYLSTLPGNWAWFCAGLALAVTSARAERPAYVRWAGEHAALCWGISFALLTVAAWAIGLPRTLTGHYGSFALQAQHVLYIGVAVFLVAPIVLAEGRRSLPATLLSTRLLAWLGLVSYGIFLWHQPLVVQFLHVDFWFPVAGYPPYTLLVAAVATAIAAVSYYGLERPILRFKEPQRAGGTGGARASTRARAVAAKSES
jgi:peptidoglycan/LPS O-acetylase OafA/YrhL